MKPDDVKKVLTGAVGTCTVAIEGGAPVSIEKGRWRMLGRTVIAKVGTKDVLLSTDKITKIEDTKQSASAAPIACQSRVQFPPRLGGAH